MVINRATYDRRDILRDFFCRKPARNPDFCSRAMRVQPQPITAVLFFYVFYSIFRIGSCFLCVVPFRLGGREATQNRSMAEVGY